MMFKVLKNNKGFTLVELVLAIAVIGIAAVGLLVLYNTTVRPSVWMNDKIQNFTNLQAALEQAKTINGGRYPLAATAISNLGNITGTTNTANILKAVIGSNTGAYTSWSYQCTAAGVLSIGVYVGDDTNTDRQNAVKTAISQNFTQWTCGDVNSSGVFTCTRSNVSCG